MFNVAIKQYKLIENSNHLSFDSQFIPNHNCGKSNVGRNKYYRNKNGIKLFTLVNNKGIPLFNGIKSGNKYDSKCLSEYLDKFSTLLHSKEKSKSKKDKLNFLADAGFCSNHNRTKLKDLGFRVLIDHNKRNTKDLKKLKNNKFNIYDKKIYKKRLIVENFYSWKNNIIPRTARIYDKKNRKLFVPNFNSFNFFDKK